MKLTTDDGLNREVSSAEAARQFGEFKRRGVGVVVWDEHRPVMAWHPKHKTVHSREPIRFWWERPLTLFLAGLSILLGLGCLALLLWLLQGVFEGSMS